MFDLNKKRISVSILLITLTLISFISKVKTKVEVPTAFDDTILKNPTEWSVMDVVDLFGCTINYNNTLFVLLLIIIMAILLFVFTDDTQISEKVKNLKEKVKKWDIKLIAISILVLIIILIIGKSCNNNSKSDYSKAMQDTLAVPDTLALPDEIAVDCVAVAPVEDTYPVEASYDELINDSISDAENKKSKGMSAFGKAKQELQQGDEGINASFSK
jgi:hypothetical protein